MVGRFRYSDLKEAAFPGAADYGSWISFSLFGVVIATMYGGSEQVESPAKASSKSPEDWFDVRSGAALGSGRHCERSLGRHDGAGCGFELEVAGSCRAPALERGRAWEQLNGGETLNDTHGSDTERAFRKRLVSWGFSCGCLFRCSIF